jgi:hypothetical protein
MPSPRDMNHRLRCQNPTGLSIAWDAETVLSRITTD